MQGEIAFRRRVVTPAPWGGRGQGGGGNRIALTLALYRARHVPDNRRLPCAGEETFGSAGASPSHVPSARRYPRPLGRAGPRGRGESHSPHPGPLPRAARAGRPGFTMRGRGDIRLGGSLALPEPRPPTMRRRVVTPAPWGGGETTHARHTDLFVPWAEGCRIGTYGYGSARGTSVTGDGGDWRQNLTDAANAISPMRPPRTRPTNTRRAESVSGVWIWQKVLRTDT